MTPKEHNDKCEALRREKSVTTLGAGMLGSGPSAVDYGSAGLKLDIAGSHLDEGIPNKQPHRVAAAYAALKEGTEEMGQWLAANGYPVDAYNNPFLSLAQAEAHLQDYVRAFRLPYKVWASACIFWRLLWS